MIVKKVTKNNEDGSYDVNWQLNEEQMGFLLTFAINSLVAEGLISVTEEDEADNQLDFLDKLDTSLLGQA